ncbi:hypothetical protein FHG65_26570 [Bacillus cereus]|uniref:Uncharacterized protein n=1 Tax=Bacillus cereus TaxID=1396 RepID=A0ABD7R972_BACCE|nr:hypothetical protein FHG65_26570 [Bacillus cereus]
MDWRPIHIIKIKVVQVGGRHLWVSFLYEKNPHTLCRDKLLPYFYNNSIINSIAITILTI